MQWPVSGLAFLIRCCLLLMMIVYFYSPMMMMLIDLFFFRLFLLEDLFALEDCAEMVGACTGVSSVAKCDAVDVEDRNPER